MCLSVSDLKSTDANLVSRFIRTLECCQGVLTWLLSKPVQENFQGGQRWWKHFIMFVNLAVFLQCDYYHTVYLTNSLLYTTNEIFKPIDLQTKTQ